MVEAVHSIRQIAHEVPAPQLPVREHVESKFLLSGEGAEDVAIFDRLEASGIRGG
jgi:hypothetical protein